MEELQTRTVGDGDFPAELDVVNWSAYLWGPLWALAYSVWPWFWGLVVLSFAATVLLGKLTTLGLASPNAFLTVAVVWMLTSRSLEAVLGVKANRLLWERRSWANSKARPTTVGDFLRSQRTWARVGLALLLPGWFYSGMRDGTFSVTDWAAVVVGLLMLAVLWVLDTWRRRRPAKLTSASS